MIVGSPPEQGGTRAARGTSKRVAREAGAVLLALVGGVLILIELVTAGAFYIFGRQFGGSLGLSFLASAGITTGLAWLAILAANRVGGWSQWLGRRTGLITLTVVVAAGVLAASGAAWAGQHQHALAERRTGGCDADEVSLLARIPVRESLTMKVIGTEDGSCARTLSVSAGGGRTLLNVADVVLVGEGWARVGGGTHTHLVAPVTYQRNGRRLVVDVAHDAAGRPLPGKGTLTLTGS
jgi:hypothetical protein